MSASKETVGRYQIVKPLAQGGMAEIFLARQEGPAGFGKTVVVKRVLAHLATDEGFIEMFQDEARLASQLSHPNIVQIFDFGQDDGTYYLAMEYLAGEDLSAVIRQATVRGRPIPPQIAALICSHTLEGLHYAHTLESEMGEPLGIVHRDISPSNVMVTYQGSVKVLDFGIAKAAGKIVKTQVGTVKGKFMYMSPEQARGRPIDGRSDVFALGAVLYEMLTGVRLFHRENQMATLLAVTEQPVPSPRQHRPDLPTEIEEILMRALEKDPAARFSSAQTMREALDEFLAMRTYAPSHVQLRQYILDLFGRDHVTKQQRRMVTSPGSPAVVDTAVKAAAAEKSEGPPEEVDADIQVVLPDDDKTPVPEAKGPVVSTPIAASSEGDLAPLLEPDQQAVQEDVATRLVDVSDIGSAEQEASGAVSEPDVPPASPKITLGDAPIGDQDTRLFSVAEVETKAAAEERKRVTLGEDAIGDQTTRLISVDEVKKKAEVAEAARRRALEAEIESDPYTGGTRDDLDDFDEPPKKKPVALGVGLGAGIAALLVILFVFVIPGRGSEDMHGPVPIGGPREPVEPIAREPATDPGTTEGVDSGTDPTIAEPMVDDYGMATASGDGETPSDSEPVEGTDTGALAAGDTEPTTVEPVDSGAAERDSGGTTSGLSQADRGDPEPRTGQASTSGRRTGTGNRDTAGRTGGSGGRRTTTGGRTGTTVTKDPTATATKQTERAGTSSRDPSEDPPAATTEGTLMVNCIPWCQIFINDRDIARTSPARDIRLSAGRHRLKVVHPPTGMERYEDIDIRPGQETVSVVRF